MAIINLEPSDLKDVKNTYFHAFPKEEAPITYQIIEELITLKTNPDGLNLGYKIDDQIVGAVGFSPVYFPADHMHSAFILAPLGVHKEYQGRKIARKLIEQAKKELQSRDVDALLVYGDPEFYGKFGFDVELGKSFIPPYPLTFPHGWQAMKLAEFLLPKTPLPFTCVNPLQNQEIW